MTCAEFKDQVALYAAGALDAAERAAMELHLAEAGPHQGCAEALARANRAAVSLGRALPPLPVDERVWKNIEAQVGTASPRGKPPEWLGWLAAAAAIIAVVILARDRANLSSQAQIAQRNLIEAQHQVEALTSSTAAAKSAAGDCERNLALAQSDNTVARNALLLLRMNGTRLVSLEPSGPKKLRASAVVNEQAHRAFVIAAMLPEQPDKVYQLWVIRGKNPPFPAGLLRKQGSGVMVGEIDPKLLTLPPDALAVSIEKSGGAASPTDVEMVGKLGT
jgi:anti-sigma-K factor RskA